MSDYTLSKEAYGETLPTNLIATAWQKTGPLVTPLEVVQTHLFNIPLISRFKNPLTGEYDVMDEPYIQKQIVQAIALAELETGLDIMPDQYMERHPYDQKAMESFGYFVVNHRPCVSVESLGVVSSDNINVWNVPLAWIDPGYLQYGQINMVPFAVATTSGIAAPVTQPVGAGLLPSLFRFSWVPGLFTIKYTTGFKDGKIPVIVNHLIGVITACEILSQLATTYAYITSQSMGIDALSQSSSGPGNAIYQIRLQELMDKRRWLTHKISRLFMLGFQFNNV